VRTLWRRVSGRYDALSLRERALVAVGATALSAFLAYVAFLAPAELAKTTQARELARKADELAGLAAQAQSLRSQAADPDAAARARIDEFRRQIGELDRRLDKLEHDLVPPGRIAELLQRLLTPGQGLRVVGMRTLPAADLSEAKTGAQVAGTGGVFKHGVEVTLQGSYGALLDYLHRLERVPERIYWERVSLRADAYPQITLTVTVYTLSLDRAWLTV
jgi:MSHA biogenesis protein MshJ